MTPDPITANHRPSPDDIRRAIAAWVEMYLAYRRETQVVEQAETVEAQ